MDIGIIAVALVALVLTVVVGMFLHKKQLNASFQDAQIESKKILEDARKEADELVRGSMRDAREESNKRRQQFEEEARQRRKEIMNLETKIKTREQVIEKKHSLIEKREAEISLLESKLVGEEKRYQVAIGEYEKTVERAKKTLQQIASMSPEEAKRELIKSMEIEARKEAQEIIRRIEEQTKVEAEMRARSVVSLAVQRISSEFVNDSTVSVVSLPSEDMKGRIIGREGRNIRAIEQATGVDLIIDDTPEAVIISCFNPIRREIAKTALERLIGDGRIHPARIEETVKRVEEEFETILRDNGEQASFDTGITDLHPELLRPLGRLKYRTTGQQTVLQHSIEVAHICGIMAGEMGLNIKKAKRAGLLHDIGKAVDQETEGHHSTVGADLCVRYNESPEVIDAIRLHHQDDLANASPYTVILHAANLLSGSRPGARKEVLETYVKRLEDMEKLIRGFPGIESAFVLQAGREVRALVTPSGVTDQGVIDLANDIASKLRQELTFPGQVRVTVLRESKFVDFAK